MDTLLDKLSREDQMSHNSLPFRLQNPADKSRINDLLENTPHIQVYDELRGQLEELIKSNHPKIKFTPTALEEAVNKHLGTTPIEEYGVWMYYPWSNRLVHILDEEEFAEVRTNRNRPKITREERAVLSQQIIGIIGLSVGQSIAITLAMERSFGEIRLADFDELELSNLNRIRSGVHQLGIKKVINVAREIAEIDPYLKVTCFPEGLTEANMDAFFTDGGKLNVLIDECDGLDIKIHARHKAKALGIPVLMEMNDRCTFDVERFDLEPNRPILHGLIDHLDTSQLQGLTNEQKIPYIMPMLGEHTISTKLKASMLEIEQSINTWPQLASAVVMGGAVVASTYRRMVLGEFTASGRYFIDLEELIGDETTPVVDAPDYPILAPLTLAVMEKVAATLNVTEQEGQATLNQEMVRTLVSAATLAPSGGNAQPWKWLCNNNTLLLFHDASMSNALLDFENLASYIGHGAAIENLRLKAQQLQLSTQISYFPLPEHPELVAAITCFEAPNITVNPLGKFMEERVTNRNIRPRQPIAPEVLQSIAEQGNAYHASLTMVEDAATMSEVAEMVAEIERLRLMHRKGHHDFFVNELRWTPEEAERTRNGVDIATVELTPSELAGFKIAREWKVIEQLKAWNGGNAFKKHAQQSIETASAIGLITMPSYQHHHYLDGGRALQKIWLAATQHNIAFQPISPLTFLFARVAHGNGIELDAAEQQTLQQFRNRFRTIFGLEGDATEVFLFRLCVAEAPKVKSLRLSLNEVLFFTNQKT